MGQVLARRVALMCCVGILAGCMSRQLESSSINRETADNSENMLWVKAQTGTAPPLLPEPGDIWAGVNIAQQPPSRAEQTNPPAPAVQAPSSPPTKGPYAVQLAATSSANAARAAWQHLLQQMPELIRGRAPTVVQADVNGRQLWRLRATGFATRADAATFCGEVQRNHGQCWVVASAS